MNFLNIYDLVRKKSFLIFSVIISVLFAIVYGSVLFNGMKQYPIIILGVIFGMIGLYWLSERNEKTLRTIYRCMVGAMVIIQVLCGFFLIVDFQTWDISSIINNAIRLVHGEQVNTVYFSRYPNNTASLLIMAGIYKISNKLFGTTSIYISILLNILLIDLSIILMSKIVKKLGNVKLSYLVGISCTLFAPFYLYVPICYSDTISMPVIIVCIYLILKCETFDDVKTRSFILIGIGVLLFIGYKIKGSVGIVLIAIGIYLFIKKNWEDFSKSITFIGCGLIISFIMWGGIVNRSLPISQEEYEKNQFPLTHWIMMGLEGLGNYNQEDVNYTISFPSYEDKKVATTRKIVERVELLGGIGLAKHMYNKATKYTWNYGTCYAERYLGDIGDEPVRLNIMHEFILTKGKFHKIFYVFTQSIYFVFLIGVLFSINKNDMCIFLLRLILLGSIMFLMIWETHPRYTLNFMSIVLVLGNIGLDNLKKILKVVNKRAGDE